MNAVSRYHREMESARKVIYQESKPYVWSLIWVLILRFSSIGLEAFSPWPFKLLIDNVLEGKALDPSSPIDQFLLTAGSRFQLGYIVVALFFISNVLLEIFEYFYSNSLQKLTRNIIFQFSRSAFTHIAHFDLSFFRHQEIGDYIYRLNYDVEAIGTFIEEVIIPLFSSSLYLMITTGIMAMIDFRLTLIALAVLPFLAGGLYIFNEKIVKVTKKSEELNSNVFSYIQEVLTHLKIVQAFSQEKHESTRFNEKLNHSLKTSYDLQKLNNALTLLIGIIITISYSLIIVIGFNDVLNGDLSTGLLVVFIFYLDNLTNPILQIVYALSQSKETAVKIERMEDFFGEKSKIHDTGTIEEMNEHDVSFENVTLLGNEDTVILDKICVDIPSKNVTVIVGISGSGKTSMISLI